ncbi:28S ribosomal protein S9, mitochondrial [Zootermopsis nevadensis]|uniref:28S ribosomal protein S9, mitochondrial n=1 Tax=Zootermopsis nevadensis TaxID=136037 RepID=UPI000B8ECD87|nr:28S ribosomal protein S9, mitochondrial [Zootermopsis nevadensis]
MAKCVAVVLVKCKPRAIIQRHFPNAFTLYVRNRTVDELRCRYATYSNIPEINLEDGVAKKAKVSRAMRAYLERAQQHDEFLKDQLHQYNVGKRHLANMMGEDPDTFTQEDIDKAIEYLFPSGLFDPKARPMMKPPNEVFPPRKAAEFDESGRPHNFLFYTGKSNLYQLLFDIVSHMNSLNEFEDKMIQKHLTPDTTQALVTAGYVWLPKNEIERTLVENLKDREYSNLISVLERLLEHPYSYRIKDFIQKFRKPMLSQTSLLDIPKPQYAADGRAYVTTENCLRKSARGEVTVRSPGTGLITINNKSIEYFEHIQDREQLLFPLIFTNMIGMVDVEATVTSGGPSGQSGAIRWGIACGLRSFVSQDMVDKMRIAGLLQLDYRKHERKKPGQAGARKKYTWKKR